MHKKLTAFNLLIVFCLIVVMTYQVVLFKQNAFEFTWLNIKSQFKIATVEDLKKIGFYCNLYNRHNCAKKIYSQLYERFPGDIDILANLAVSLALTNQKENSLPYFNSYFANGGDSQRVAATYANTLVSLGKYEEAIPWFYNILQFDPNNASYGKKLISVLNEVGQNTEAQSLSVALQYSDINNSSATGLDSAYMNDITPAQLPNRIPAGEVKLKYVDHFKIPAFDGQHFFVPIKGANQIVKYIVATEDDVDSEINKMDLAQLGLTVINQQHDVLTVDHLQMGRYRVAPFIFKLCEECESHIGGKTLAKYNIQIDRRSKIPYLNLGGDDE